MTIQAAQIFPNGIATLAVGGRTVVVEQVVIGVTYGGVLEGAPTPELDAILRSNFRASVRQRWGSRATHVVEPETVEIAFPARVLRRMPSMACAAWLSSDPVRNAGAASELVLIWWTEVADLPIGQLVERALAGGAWEEVAADFDY